MSRKRATPLNKLYPQADAKCLDLMKRLLEFVPKKRYTVSQALEHPYMEKLHDPQDEPEAVTRFNFAFEQ
eukprot:326630-Amorphochlora_amoeboformis.AAC.1